MTTRDQKPIMLMTGMDLRRIHDAGRGHRLNHLIRYLDNRGLLYTAVFIVFDKRAVQWKSGSGIYVGLPISYPKLPFSRGTGLHLEMNTIGLLRSFLGFGKRANWEVCIVHGEFMAILAIVMRYLGQLNSIVYEDLDYLPAFSNPSFTRTRIEIREDWAIRQSDLIVTVSDELQKLRQSRGAKETIVIPNGVDYRRFSGKSDAERKPILLYSGSLTSWCGVDKVIQALPLIRRRLPNARLRIIGGGYKETELRNLAKSFQVNDAIDFLGWMKYDQLPGMYRECSIGMATFPRNELMHYSFPIKIPEYWAAGLPVVSTGSDGTKAMLEANRCGIVVNGSPDEIAETCVWVLSDDSVWEDFSQRARATAQRLDWNVLFDEEMQQIARFTR